MTKKEAEAKAKKYQYLVNKKFQNKITEKIYVIVDVSINKIFLKDDYQVVIGCSPIIKDVSSKPLTEEIDYFLGKYCLIEDSLLP